MCLWMKMAVHALPISDLQLSLKILTRYRTCVIFPLCDIVHRRCGGVRAAVHKLTSTLSRWSCMRCIKAHCFRVCCHLTATRIPVFAGKIPSSEKKDIRIYGLLCNKERPPRPDHPAL